jgi:hypothetical protein
MGAISAALGDVARRETSKSKEVDRYRGAAPSAAGGARLELRALYRALDRMLLAQDVPAGLRRLQALDADFAEALWVLDQPRGRFNLSAMVDDTEASLNRLAPARAAFLASFDDATRARLEDRAQATRTVLSPTDAYLEIPGRDPAARRSRP